jgi:Transglutaminase-like superfamily
MTRRSGFALGRRMTLVAGALFFVGTNVHGQDSWDAIYLAGSKIGYVHTYVEKVPNKGKDYLRVRVDIEQSLKRGDDVAITRLRYGTIETLDGQVLRLDTLTSAGAQNLRAHGDVIKGAMTLMLESGGQPQKLVIPWSRDVRGPYAAEQSMARNPMKPHETRRLKMFMPTLNKICDIELRSLSVEPVIMGDGSSRPLLHIEQTTKVDDKPKPEFDIKLWVDADGQVLKQEQDLLGGYVQYRTTKEAAMSPGGPIQFDLIKGTVIKVARKIPDPEKTRHIKYRIALDKGDSSQVIPNDSRQTVVVEANSPSAILELKSQGPLDGQAGPAEIDPQYLKPNALISSDDSRVEGLARRATRNAVDPWEKAQRINHWVYQNMKHRNFEVAFAAANEVARDLSGDCTEHAVLAAAMCRAVGIPARVVIGLIYVDKLDGFGFHMWNEVSINQRWVALDPSWDQTTVDAVHIKLSDTSLEGVSPFEAFLPVIRVMGKLQIEPLELR